MTLTKSLKTGALAGAAGTMALDVATYADMLGRGRPSSSLPAEAADRLAHQVGLPLGPEGQDQRENRKSALGSLLGYATGIGVAVGYALMTRKRRARFPLAALGLGGGAMVAADLPMVLEGLTDVRKWSTADWMADLLPHAFYGAVAAAVLGWLDR